MTDLVKELPEEDLGTDEVSYEEPPMDPLTGLFSLTVAKAEPARSKGSDGKEHRAVKLELTVTGSYPSGEAPPRKMRIFDRLTLNKEHEFLIRRMKRAATAAGVEPIRKSSDEAVSDFCDNITGQSVICRLAAGKPRDGKIYTEVKAYMTADEANNVAAEGVTAAGDASPEAGAEVTTTAKRRRAAS